jgi:glycerophosphoryl diester phosphodiesterase
MHVLAHRGDARRRPENTVHALLAALDIPGCDGLEFDVRAARDGTPVIAHDETLARVFGRPERVADLSSAELAEAGLPTLHDVLAEIPSHAFLDVELKEDVGSAVVPVLRAARGEDLANAVVSSFDHATLETVRRLAPGWPAWLNVLALDDAAIAAAVRLGARGVSADEATIDAAGVEAARAAGLDVAAWTIRHVRRLAELAALGVTAVCVEDDALDRAAATVAAFAAAETAPAAGQPTEEEPPG